MGLELTSHDVSYIGGNPLRANVVKREESPPTAVRAPGIQPELDLLAQNCADLEEAISRLANRINFVLRPDPIGGFKDEEHEGRSAVYNHLVERNDHIRRMILTINGLADSVDN